MLSAGRWCRNWLVAKVVVDQIDLLVALLGLEELTTHVVERGPAAQGKDPGIVEFGGRERDGCDLWNACGPENVRHLRARGRTEQPDGCDDPVRDEVRAQAVAMLGFPPSLQKMNWRGWPLIPPALLIPFTPASIAERTSGKLIAPPTGTIVPILMGVPEVAAWLGSPGKA